MNKVIKDIIGKECSNKEKKKLLDLLSDEIKIARGVLSGEYKYCSGCDDYYLTKSYLSDTETKDTKICIYQYPINSSGYNYTEGYVDITYSICPKGHKYEISRKERR